jgi:hypothetical protein
MQYDRTYQFKDFFEAIRVDDAPLGLWHLISAWISLGSVQSDLSELHAMRFSLKYLY